MTTDQASPSIPKRCTALRRNGERCTAPALPESDYCFGHDPGRAAKRAEGQRKGGRSKASAVRLRRLAPPSLVSVFDKMAQALDDVLAGELDPKKAQAAASIARAMVAVLTAGETEQRLRDVEERLRRTGNG